MSQDQPTPKSKNFIEQIIDADLESGKNGNKVATRFPPEPNGYLHIGHAKSICLNFGLAAQYHGTCNLRFDDTNPCKEENEFIDSIQDNVRWLGFDWEDRLFYASDYYEQLFEYAIQLIQSGKAYVCELTADQIREYRGTLTKPGTNSPYRDRPIAESLDLFHQMRSGEFDEGRYVLRAKIDMASPNINMRDPVIYRILKESHPRTGNTWCIYPMYDYAHPISDALEGITHSVCTLEFEDHRPLYNWCLEQLPVLAHPQQIEFARLNITYTVLSKRKLLELVTKNDVDGWDDPRMPTLSGLRRRGFTPKAIRDFCEKIGVSKANSTVDVELLHFCQREDLNQWVPRVMVVINPVKLIIDNYPDDAEEYLDAENNPEDESMGKRQIPFSKELWIEREDVAVNPPPKWLRLAPGTEVRFKNAYYLTCQQIIQDNVTGEITEVHCTYDKNTKGGWSSDGRKVKGTIHWVSAKHAIPAEVRLYDHLFTKPNPEDLPEGQDYKANLNPDSLKVFTHCKCEPSLQSAKIGDAYQFLRKGYFCADLKDATPEHLVFNQTVTLKDSYSVNMALKTT